MMVFDQGGFVAGGASRKGKGLNQTDFTKDIERAVDRPEAHGGHLVAHALENRLRRKVRSGSEGAQHGGALLRETVARLQQPGVDGLDIHTGRLPQIGSLKAV